MKEKILSKYNSLPLQVKASFWFLICSFLQKGITFITTPVFTRILTLEEYGLYNVFNSWESMFSVVISLNLCYGVYTQGLIKFDEEKKQFSSAMQGLTLTLVVIWATIYAIFYKSIDSITGLNYIYMILMFIFIWMTSAFNFWAGEQRVEYKYKKLIIITLAVSILNPLISIILIRYMSNNVLARILGIVLVAIVFYSGMFISQQLQGKRFYSKKYWKYALKFNIPLIPHYLSQTVLNSSDRIMIEKINGSSKAGIYSLAYSLSLVMTLFNNALLQTISPWIYKKIKGKETYKITNIAYTTMFLIAGVNILLIAFAPEIVRIFAPITYLEAIWIIPPVAMSAYFMYLYDLFAKFEFYYEKTKFIATATVIGAIANIILNYVFINKYGYIAAGYTTLICYILYALAHYICMQKICKSNDIYQPYDLKKVLAISVSFISIGFFIAIFYNNVTIRYIIILSLIWILIVKRNYIIEKIKNVESLRKE